MIAAVLHDVIEDGGITPDQLRAEGFPEAAVAAVETVTKRPEEKGTSSCPGRSREVRRSTDHAEGGRAAYVTGASRPRHGPAPSP